MVVFGLQCDKESSKFMRYHQEQLSREDVIKLFEIHVKEEQDNLWLVSYNVLPPDPLWFSCILILIAGIFNFLPTWYLVAIGVFVAASFLWTRYFYRMMIFAGMRKQRNDGKVELLTAQEVVRRLYGWDK